MIRTIQMLDGCLHDPYFQRAEDGSLLNNNVCTGLAWEQEDNAPSEAEPQAKGRGKEKASIERRFEITFSTFLTRVWRSMTGGGAAGVSASSSAVFQEIITSIKGASYIDGLGTAGSRGRPLTREQYVSLPAKVLGSFGSCDREWVYDLYEKYTASCRQLGAYDSCDVGFHILKELRNGRHRPVPQLDWIYVDEVQDFVLQQLELLLSVAGDKVSEPRRECPHLVPTSCPSPLPFSSVPNSFKNKLLLTGDTCQTIARGVTFRFSDLKQLFYAENQTEGSGVNMPEMLQLTVNYRTHQHVLNLANAVVDILKTWFPVTIDVLQAERAHFSG
jgi:hypothetical protein